MTPLRTKQEQRRIIRVERVSSDKLNSDRVHYAAGGTYLGIIINKAVNGNLYLQTSQHCFHHLTVSAKALRIRAVRPSVRSVVRTDLVTTISHERLEQSLMKR